MGWRLIPHSLWDKHTKHCVKCRQSVANIAKVARALQVAGIALAVLALGLAAGGLVLPTVAAALLAAGAWLARRKLLKWGREGFINTRRLWEETGGLSLAPKVVAGLSEEDVSVF